MAKYLTSTKKKKTPAAVLEKIAPRLAELPANPRRRFLKMAGAVTAAMMLQQHAKGMVVAPKFNSKWLAAVQLEDVNLVEYSGCECNLTEFNSLPITIPKQEQSSWCWVAVALGVAQYYGSLMESAQCDVYNQFAWDYFNLSVDCCAWSPDTFSSGGPCNQPAAVANLMLNLHIYAGTLQSPQASFPTIVGQIYLSRPVVMHLSQISGNIGSSQYFNHFAVLSAYSCGPGSSPDDPVGWEACVDIWDPYYGYIFGVRYCHLEQFYSLTDDNDSGAVIQWDQSYLTCAPSDFSPT